jgi:hypothetical protein
VSFEDWTDDLDVEVPEFNFPAREAIFNRVLPLREQLAISRAAQYAHAGKYALAEQAREGAGYNGLS